MKKITLIEFGIVLIVVFLFTQCGLRGGTEVKVAKVVRGELIVSVSATGTVRSNHEAKLTTVSSGRVNKIMVEENQAVEKGKILLDLDSTAQAEKDYNRLAKLGEKGFVTPREVELAKEQWKNTFISAPFSGTIVKKFVEVGEPLMGGTPAFLIADLHNMLIETNIDETDIGEVKVGQKVEVVLDAYKDLKLDGKVVFIARSSLEVKEKGITYLVKVKLSPTDVTLRLGMTGDVYIFVANKKNVLMVPYTAIGEEKGVKFVFAAEKNMLKKKVIKIGLENYDNTEIVDGLNENDIVVESNISKLKDGEKVKIK
ncbi:MAG: efflux RND transporter periplasmic adaptor subunit [Candidatus Firestonebacteria bacterium]